MTTTNANAIIDTNTNTNTRANTAETTLHKAQQAYDLSAVHGRATQNVLESMFAADNDSQKLEARRASIITKLGGLKVRAVGAILYTLGLSYLPRTELYAELCAKGTHPLDLLKTLDDVLSNKSKPKGKMAQLEKSELRKAYTRLYKSALGHKTRFCHATKEYKTEQKIQGVALSLDRLLQDKGLSFAKYDPSTLTVHITARKLKDFNGAQVELPEHHANMTLNELMQVCEQQVQYLRAQAPKQHNAGEGGEKIEITEGGEGGDEGGKQANTGEGGEVNAAVKAVEVINALNAAEFETLKLLLATSQEGNACALYNDMFEAAQDAAEQDAAARQEKVINPEPAQTSSLLEANH